MGPSWSGWSGSCREFDDLVAVNDVDLLVPDGDVFGLIVLRGIAVVLGRPPVAASAPAS